MHALLCKHNHALSCKHNHASTTMQAPAVCEPTCTSTRAPPRNARELFAARSNALLVHVARTERATPVSEHHPASPTVHYHASTLACTTMHYHALQYPALPCTTMHCHARTNMHYSGSMATDLECHAPLTVFPRGATGPYDICLTAPVASELLILKEIDIMKLDKMEEPIERTFIVTQLTITCDVPISEAKASELSEEQEKRKEEARERIRQQQRNQREDENRNTIRIYLEFDGSHAMGPPGLRSDIERDFETALKGAFGSILKKVNHHRPMDEYKTPKSTTTFFLHFVDISHVTPSHFSTLKYRQVSHKGVYYKPVHSRIHATIRNHFRFATCCYRPGCEGPQSCELKQDYLKRFRNHTRGSLFDPADIPEWKRERLQREIESREKAHHNAKRLINILEGKQCKKFTMGICERGSICRFVHDVTPQPASTSAQPEASTSGAP